MKKVLSTMFPVALCLFHVLIVVLSFALLLSTFFGFDGVPLIVCILATALSFAAVLILAAIKRGGTFMIVYSAILLCASILSLTSDAAIDFTIQHVIASMPFLILLVLLEEHVIVAHIIITLFYTAILTVCVVRRVRSEKCETAQIEQ